MFDEATALEEQREPSPVEQALNHPTNSQPLTLKQQVIYSLQGQIIGRTGPEPDVDKGPTAGELIQQGLNQPIINAENEIRPILDRMVRLAQQSRDARDKIGQWDFDNRLKIDKTRADLFMKFQAYQEQLHELRKVAGRYSQSTPFLTSMDAFVLNLEQHFSEQGPFVSGRF